MEFTNEQRAYIMEVTKRYLNNTRDSGSMGRTTEVVVRAILNSVIERVHPEGIGDITRKSKGAIEVKTGCGWLTSPMFFSKEEALQEIENFLPHFKRSRYVAYAPNVFINPGMTVEQMVLAVLSGVRVYTHKEFLTIIQSAGLFVAKRSSVGLWGVSIQQFRNSMKREALLYSLLESNGMSLSEFAIKWKG